MPPLRFWCLAVTCSDLPDHGQAISRGSLQQVRGGGPAALLTAEGEAQERLALPPISPGRTSVDTYRTARRFSLLFSYSAGEAGRTVRPSRPGAAYLQDYLAVDRTGGCVLVWVAGNATTGLPVHSPGSSC
jgi:hypothetical protein